ncbi:MAG: hypothetical protein U1F77_19815 [Kiritimatiellia bacterium]
MLKYKLECISVAFILVSLFNTGLALLATRLGKGKIDEKHTAWESTSHASAFKEAFGYDMPILPPYFESQKSIGGELRTICDKPIDASRNSRSTD